jgi:hypothetical protein
MLCPEKGRTIMGAIRTSMLVMAVAVMLPSPPESGQSGSLLVHSAIRAMSNLGVLCTGKDECTTAEYVLGRIEAKARYNLILLHAWARHPEENLAPIANQARADPIMTGSAIRLASQRGDAAPQNTLRIDDLIPSWRGPAKSG